MLRAALVAIATLAACKASDPGPGQSATPGAPELSRSTGSSQPTPAPTLPPQTQAPAPEAGATAPAKPPRCDPRPFTGSHVPEEASGAVLLESGELLVVADSGHRGEFAILAPDGALRAKGALPLGEGASDDIEGLSRRGEEVLGITSSGWVRHWKRQGDGFVLTTGPYPIDPTGAATCNKGTNFNCGPNYEGLCVRPAAVAGPCDALAVANAEAALRCLTFGDSGRLQLAAEPVLRVGFPGQLSGCAFAPTGQLWLVANRLGGNALAVVDNWGTPDAARLRLVGGSAQGFVEAVAAGADGVLYVLSDEDRGHRNHRKFRCAR